MVIKYPVLWRSCIIFSFGLQNWECIRNSLHPAIHFDIQQCFASGNKSHFKYHRTIDSYMANMGWQGTGMTKKSHNVGCTIWPAASMLLKMELLKMENSLQVNSVKYLLIFLVCRCSIFRGFLPSDCTMLLFEAMPFAKTHHFFFLHQWFISLMSKHSRL